MAAALVLAVLTHQALSQSAVAQSVRYVYDELGRLIAVIDPSGDTAVYTYDAAGNVVAISRHNSSTVSVLHFTPESGPSGTTVTIYGTGFSQTPSQNTVTFNGTAASVASSTVTSMVVTVPSGASSGSVAVTTPAGSAQSAEPFSVTDDDGPTVTGFSPAIGVWGTPLTIDGTGFDAVLANNVTRLNVALASLSTGSATQLATSVPVGATSGRIRVRTAGGEGISVDDFFIPPPPYGLTDVGFTGRIPFGSAFGVPFSSR